VLYKALLGLGIMIEVDILKCDGQYSKLIHVLTILMIFLIHDELWMITLRCLQEYLSGLGVEVLLYLLINDRNSSCEKADHKVVVLFEILSNKTVLTCWFWAELKDSWRAYQRSLSSRQEY